MKVCARFGEILIEGFVKWTFYFRREICKFSATVAPPIWTG